MHHGWRKWKLWIKLFDDISNLIIFFCCAWSKKKMLTQNDLQINFIFVTVVLSHQNFFVIYIFFIVFVSVYLIKIAVKRNEFVEFECWFVMLTFVFLYCVRYNLWYHFIDTRQYSNGMKRVRQDSWLKNMFHCINVGNKFQI